MFVVRQEFGSVVYYEGCWVLEGPTSGVIGRVRVHGLWLLEGDGENKTLSGEEENARMSVKR